MGYRTEQAAFRQALRRVLILPLIFALVLAAALVWQIQELMNATGWSSRADRIIAEANGLQTSALELESGMRGYLLTDNPVFLQRADATMRQAQQHTDELKRLVAEPNQQRQLAGIEASVADYVEYQRGILKLKSDGKDYLAPIRRLEGKRRMDLVRAEISTFVREGTRIRAERTESARRQARSTMLSTCVIALLFGAFSAWQARRHLVLLSGRYASALQGEQEKSNSLMLKTQELSRAKEELQQAHALLERRIEERTRALQERSVALSAANKELEAFSYSVSHDLRSPLRGIDGFSQALVEDYHDRLDETARGYLQRIRAGTQRMGRLIDDLLNLSRLTRAQMKVEKVNLSELASSVIEELRRLDPERQASIRIEEGLGTEGDPGLLRAVLQNLLSNAWKFTSKNPAAQIEFGKTDTAEGPAFFVRDNGVGFDMAYSDKLFGAFQRLHAASEFPGTGVGLATVRRIVHRHGGHIWAESKPGQGSAFYFTLAATASAAHGTAA